MKYRLINLESKEEHFCDKVTLEGYDYYIDYFKEIQVGKWYISNQAPRLCIKIKEGKYPYIHLNNKGEEIADFHTWKGVIICTTNPNIDILKVVDEVEKICEEEWLRHPNNDILYGDSVEIENAYKAGVWDGYNKSQKTHPFSEEDMIEFAKFFKKYEFIDDTTEGELYADDLTGTRNCYTTKELLQLWQEQQPKKVYYNE